MTTVQQLNGRVVVPGDRITLPAGTQVIPGSGIVQSDGQVLLVTKAGTIATILKISEEETATTKKPVPISVENTQKRYCPTINDQILGIVTSKHGDHYRLDIGASREAYLPVLSFQGATKRNRPNLSVGALVYAQVSIANADMKAQVTCISPHFKKEWMSGESLFGELQGGYMFSCSSRLVRDLRSEQSVVLNSLAQYLPFEVAVGANGRVWVRAGVTTHTILASNCIANSEHLTDGMTALMVKELVSIHGR